MQKYGLKLMAIYKIISAIYKIGNTTIEFL